MKIKPALKSYDLTMIVVGLVIGMGIFRTPAEVASKAGTIEVFFAAWVVGAVVSMLGAMTFAEIGVRHPVAGGFYGIFSRCYHPAFAFMVNWIIVISNAVSTAAVAIMGSEYLAPLILPGWGESGVQVVSIASVVLLYGINMAGFRFSARTLNGLMVFKLLLLVIIVAIAFLGYVSNTSPMVPSVEANGKEFSPITAFFLCFIPVFFTYGGYQQTMNFGGDVINPGKNIPKAVLTGISIVLITYLAANFAYTKVIGFENLKSSSTLAADVVGVAFGAHAHDVVSVLMFLSVMAYVNVSVMSNPRVYHAMAQDGVMPSVFGKVNTKTQVQEFGVSFFCLVIFVVLFFLSSFERILGFIMFFDSISILSAAAAIFILRRRDNKTGESEIGFRIWGYPWLPAIFILVYASVSLSVMYADPQVYVVGIILFVSGYPLYHIMRRLLKAEKLKTDA
ncbi:MAG: APC family permease [Bacteroidota bacterium]